jgi:hypothetical protein
MAVIGDDGGKPKMDEVTEARLEAAIVVVARAIDKTGETTWVPLLEKLEAELKKMKGARDGVARARQITEAYNAKGLDDDQTRAVRLVQMIRPLLAGNQPEAVGAALGELVAIFLAGHHPSTRAEARQTLLELIDELVPVSIEEMIEQGRVPMEWQ